MNNELDAKAPIEYVGFWPRVGASLIDSIATIGLILVVTLVLFGNAGQDASYLSDFTISWVIPAIAVMVFWITRGATPGKMVVDAVIVDAHTFQQPTNWQLVGRYLGYFVSTVPFGLGLIWVAFDPRKQGWHDKMANTVVIRKRA